MKQFPHHTEQRWLTVEDRDDGLRWYRIFKLNPDRLHPSSADATDRYVALGAIAWWSGGQKCERPDGTPADASLRDTLLMTLDSAKAAKVID